MIVTIFRDTSIYRDGTIKKNVFYHELLITQNFVSDSVSADPLKPHDISEGVYIEASRIFVILVIVISCST